MRREGSPLTGVGVVLAKEAADYLSGARMWLIETLVFLTAIGAAYAAILSIRATIGESPFLFLRLFTMAQDPLPSFISLLGFSRSRSALTRSTASSAAGPTTRALGPVFYSQIQEALLGTPLPAAQSFLLIWPQLTGLVATMIAIFAIAYIIFQRQEIRA